MKKIVAFAFALTVSAVSSLSFAQDIKGDANAGEKKIAMCIGCHGIVGYQASFPEVYKVPKISGQSEKYITTVLNAYKKGERKHPTMRGIADSLSDQDMADISAYYANHGKVEGASLPDKAKEPNAKVAALLTKGACASCHGENFAKPIDSSYPKIAGQNADYLFVALKSYKVEGAATWGRSNGVMGGVAKQFSNAELKELANYMAAQQGDLKTVPQKKFR
ncbi:c-type cytochrome [Limnohabitans sp.]|uniref:c-type cytochrome n=1 Tax=Limnohabitans sp. TaxID=1907725 RepID=UPI00286ECD27|nr:c-type cytochrome [Limnohabitans sp.]